MIRRLDRRRLLRLGAGGSALAGAAAALPLLLGRGSRAADHPDHRATPAAAAPAGELAQAEEHAGHSPSATLGDVDVERMGFDPSVFVRSFDYGEATTMADGTVVREFAVNAIDKEIEIAPGVFFPAWTFNGQVPGPTLRANEGEKLRVHFGNGSAHPHTMHFYGVHSAFQDGVTGIGRGDVVPGERHS